MAKTKEEEFKVTLQREKSLSYLDGCLTGLEFANSCDDAISRKEVLETFGGVLGIWGRKALMEMKPVLPTYQKGKWIKGITHEKRDYFGDRVKVANYTCSECGRVIEDIAVDDGFANNIKDYPYCHCGSRNEVEDGN